MHFFFQYLPLKIEKLCSLWLDYGHLPVFEKNNFLGVAEKRIDVRRDKKLFFA